MNPLQTKIAEDARKIERLSVDVEAEKAATHEVVKELGVQLRYQRRVQSVYRTSFPPPLDFLK